MSARRRLSHLLLASHMGLVLLLALLLLATGAGTIRSAVVGQARAEAERTASEARRRLQEWRRELAVGVGLLIEQPTLPADLERGQFAKVRDLVAHFHQTSGIGFIRVRLDDETVAEFGPPPPGDDTGLVFDAAGDAWLVVHDAIPGLPRATVVVAEPLGERLEAKPIPDHVAVELRPLVLREPAAADAWSQALYHVSVSGEGDTVEGVGDAAAARISSLRDEAGRPEALLSARIGDGWVEKRTIEWYAALGFTSLGMGALALVLAFFVAARIARPFAQVARDAERLGGGDLDTPISPPRTSLAEPVALAASLEQMRRQVGSLTAAERAQREELDAVLDGVDEGIVKVDADNRIQYANRQFHELVGGSRAELLGRPFDEVLQSDGDGAADAPPAPAGAPATLERRTPAGVMRPLTVRRQAASGDRQVLIVREETAIEAARGMRDRILANLAHEFQTPLSAQIASIELLRDHLRASPDHVAVRLADAQYRGVLRLSQLVDNLLDSVRIESGEMRLRRQPVDLANVVADALELMQPLIDQRDQRVVRSLSPGPSLNGDSQRLFSVMVNLLANANKFAPDQTTIWVEMEWSDDRVIVWVEDEGPGLPAPNLVNDLFAPFKRAPHEEPSQRGTGLGLAVVYAIVVAHGGHVRVEPPAHRRGTRIGIVLPVEETS